MDDSGIDKQQVLRNVAEAGTPPLVPPVAVAPPPSPRLGNPHRQFLSTLVIGMIGLLWLVAGLAGSVSAALIVGAALLVLSAVSAVSLRKSA